MTDTPKLTDDEIRALLDKATDGPWEAVRNSAYWEVNPAERKEGDPYAVGNALPSSPDNPDGLQLHNARLIAAAPDLARLALERGAKIERLRALLDARDAWARGEPSNPPRAALNTQESGND